MGVQYVMRMGWVGVQYVMRMGWGGGAVCYEDGVGCSV